MLALAAAIGHASRPADSPATYTYSVVRTWSVDKMTVTLDSAASIDLNLAWTSSDATLDVSLIDPHGTTVSTKENANPKAFSFKAYMEATGHSQSPPERDPATTRSRPL
jgi:hypothetical protein